MDSTNYSSDSPVFAKEQDRFSRWAFSERVAQVISKRTDPSSIVIGLYGIWGDGKTSVLNFIEKSLEKNDNVICIKFNPWRFGTEEELLTGFFFTIADALDTELVTTGDKFKAFVKRTASDVTSLAGVEGVGNIVSSFISTIDINELRKRVENELQNAKKRILVLIDDVDRLEKTEIHTLFRIVKLTADFKYTSYILAFDKDVVATSLQDRYSSTMHNAGEAFLEKIIQIPLHLPSIEKQVLREFCFQGIDEAVRLAEIDLSQVQIQDFVNSFSYAFDDCLTTPRKAKLYGNILLFALPILKDEVNPVDLMLIEGIRVFCPLLYELLRTNKKLFTGTFTSNIYSNNEQEKDHIKKIIDRTLDKAQNINKESFIYLLKKLFPKLEAVYGNRNYGSDWYENWNNAQRICSEHYFSRYFTYSIPRNDVSDKLIDKLIYKCENFNLSFDESENPFNDILNTDNAGTLIRKLRQRDVDLNEASSYSLAIAIAQKNQLFPNPDTLYSFLNPFAQAAMLISSLIQNQSINNREKLACDCIDNSPSLDFKLEIFRWLKRKDDDKPEQEAFSDESINIIGKHLGNSIIEELGDTDITLVYPNLVSYIFYILNKYVNHNFANDYITKQILKDDLVLVRILESYVPTSWGMESGLPHKSNFEREQYNHLAEVLDTKIIIENLEKYFPSFFESIEDDFPRDYDDIKEKSTLFIKQFIWLHKYITKEAEITSE
ncbi:P-loop NTPase fold protein [Gilliamella sp. A7]|uniref:KAP family P-loop NTPase fold protein n=1 Tax=Gilliamella sp. A7 TaxID=1970465 RepID=UPI000A3444EA|nr:P-loop NTPase fold protein [Gilliamella sp. A7]OTQ57630.1 NTPase [Gilliamella sp. A7]